MENRLQIINAIKNSGGTRIKLKEDINGSGSPVQFRGFNNAFLYVQMNIDREKFWALEKEIWNLGAHLSTVIFPHQENELAWQVNCVVSELDKAAVDDPFEWYDDSVAPLIRRTLAIMRVPPKESLIAHGWQSSSDVKIKGNDGKMYPAFIPHQAGCYVDSNKGQYVGEYVQEIANSRGWSQLGITGAAHEDYHEDWVAAEEYLQKFAPAGFHFGSTENGDWGLWAVEEEASGL